ncbi:hypothetical protein IV203_019669 [Nitzschia inconspicua]|uniref:Uncharacterized protein n=1 Tax=Nitzschia inconspicua TaxID=303405 RepID=A0A9K3Q7E9_9STRA|nr:hypothetical protein IV203_019669 [Nitzschia inconspicua]
MMQITTNTWALLSALAVGIETRSSAFVSPRGPSLSRWSQPSLQLSSDKNNDVPNSLNFQRGLETLFSNDIKTADYSSTRKGQSKKEKTDLVKGGRTSLLLLSSTLAPVAAFLDDNTNGWALSYADLRPESEQTAIGRSFLATNIAYAVVGLLLSAQGEIVLGFMTEVVSVASFCYHYTQLQQPYNRTDDATVKLALLVDYVLAVSSIFIGLLYLVEDQTLPSPDVLASSGIGIGCLLACWVWEKGYPYIIFHSLWHFFSAASAYSIGISHAS